MTIGTFSLSPRAFSLAVIGLGIVVAAGLGYLVPEDDLELVQFALLVVGACILVVRPELGLLLLTASLPLESYFTVQRGVTATRMLGAAIFGVWILHKLLLRETWDHLWMSNLFRAGLLVLSISVSSALWATSWAFTYSGLLQLVQLFVLGLLVIDLVNSPGRLVTLAKVLVAMAFVAALLTIEQYFVDGAKRAGDNITGGVNGTAAMLVLTVPFAFYLVRGQRAWLWRLLGLVYICAASVAVAVTFSRTSYILLALTLLGYGLSLLADHRKRQWALVLILIVVLFAGALPQDLILERVSSVLPSLQDVLGTATGSTVVNGRGLYWAVGLAMFNDYPLLGVGYNNYGPRFTGYLPQVGAGLLYASNRRVTHSSYITFMAQQGLFGLACWLLLYATAGYNLVRAWFAATRARHADLVHQILAVGAMFLLILCYGFSLDIHQDKLFWVVLGLSVALRRLASPAAEPRPISQNYASR